MSNVRDYGDHRTQKAATPLGETRDHHLPVFTFEAAVKQAPVRYVLGLTATPYRRDGLQDIITMQCGPIRCKMPEAETDLLKQAIIRGTSFAYASDDERPIQEIFRDLVNDPARNELI